MPFPFYCRMKDIDKLFSDLFDLQRQGLVVDTRLVVDDGEVAIHWPLWWAELGHVGADNVVLLPGVSLLEVQHFVDVLYGRHRHDTCNISNKHYTVIEDTGVTDDVLNNNSEGDDTGIPDDISNNNSEGEDVKLEAYEKIKMFRARKYF